MSAGALPLGKQRVIGSSAVLLQRRFQRLAIALPCSMPSRGDEALACAVEVNRAVAESYEVAVSGTKFSCYSISSLNFNV